MIIWIILVITGIIWIILVITVGMYVVVCTRQTATAEEASWRGSNSLYP